MRKLDHTTRGAEPGLAPLRQKLFDRPAADQYSGLSSIRSIYRLERRNDWPAYAVAGVLQSHKYVAAPRVPAASCEK